MKPVPSVGLRPGGRRIGESQRLESGAGNLENCDVPVALGVQIENPGVLAESASRYLCFVIWSGAIFNNRQASVGLNCAPPGN